MYNLRAHISGFMAIGFNIFLGMVCFVFLLTLVGVVFMIRNNCRCQVCQSSLIFKNSVNNHIALQ